MITITQYTHRPNMTELGWASTHETYMLVPKSVDLSEMFPPQIDVDVKDVNEGKEYCLKSAFGREFRVNQMGEIYRDYDVHPGDEIIITKIEKDDLYDYFITVKKYNRAVLTVTANGTEISSMERLGELGTNKSSAFAVFYEGEKQIVTISFKESKKKRTDSPNETDFYDVHIGEKKIENGVYYLTLGEKNILEDLPKCEYGKVKVNEHLIKGVAHSIKLSKKINKLQQITYGAPGTGKSYGLKDLINSMSHFRTTFHPDSDYASFVGAYKPTMSKVALSNGYNTLDEGNKVDEEQITYKFVPQSFIKAYVSAWKNYKKEKPTVLVIEEINRGNCAQIFGDLFQLLDRGNNGFSSYPIEADADVANYLKGEMPDLTECAEEIDALFAKSYPEGITQKIKSGELLLLPNNLYIWATMNTSDQSLFPIDSAFKRRWDWKFIKIADAHKGWFIQLGNEGCDWWTFISKMNKLIAKETSSDDKKMGYFFCKPQSEDEKIITEDQFVGKVLFYLWNDVFKDGDTALFNVSDDTDDEPTFEAFYNDDNTPNVKAIRKFIVKVVGEENIKSSEATAEEQPDDTEAE